MGIGAGDVLHEAVDGDGGGVDGDGPHHADHVSLEEGAPSVLFVLVAEALGHALVLELSEFVRLHEGLHVIEGIVEHPIAGSSNTTGDDGDVDGNVFLSNVRRGQLGGYFFDDGEVKAETGALSDGGGALAAVESLEAVLLENFYGCVQRSRVDLISLSSLNLDPDPRMLNGALSNLMSYHKQGDQETSSESSDGLVDQLQLGGHSVLTLGDGDLLLEIFEESESG